jgi:hypothetical protein
VDHAWNFDDGARGTGELADHAFASPGLYSVRLLVHDDDGGAGAYAQKEIWVREAPVGRPDSYSLAWEGSLDVAAAAGVLANDSINRLGGEPAVELVSAPAHGQLDLDADGALRYRPDSGFSGNDSFTYRVEDAGGFGSNATQASIVVSAPPSNADPGPGSGAAPQGGSPAPASPAVAPETRIRKLRAAAGKVTLWFAGSGPSPLSFSCALDKQAFKSCASPKTYTRLKPGKHTIRVRSEAGALADPTPASRAFTIKSRKRRPRR